MTTVAVVIAFMAALRLNGKITLRTRVMTFELRFDARHDIPRVIAMIIAWLIRIV